MLFDFASFQKNKTKQSKTKKQQIPRVFHAFIVMITVFVLKLESITWEISEGKQAGKE